MNLRILKSAGGSFKVQWLNKQANWSEMAITQIMDEAISFTGAGKETSGMAILISPYDPLIKAHAEKPEYKKDGKTPIVDKVKAFRDEVVPLSYRLDFTYGDLDVTNKFTFQLALEVEYLRWGRGNIGPVDIYTGQFHQKQSCLLRP